KLGLVVASPIAVLALVPYQLNISAPCEVISSGPVTLHARTGGIVKQFLVETGQWVKAGDVVAVLLDEDLRRQRNLYRKQIASRKDLDEAVGAYRSALAREGEAQTELKMMAAGYREE